MKICRDFVLRSTFETVFLYSLDIVKTHQNSLHRKQVLHEKKVTSALLRISAASGFLILSPGAGLSGAFTGSRRSACSLPGSAGGIALQGSFSAVSKRNFASKHAFESIRRDLDNALLFWPMQGIFLADRLFSLDHMR